MIRQLRKPSRADNIPNETRAAPTKRINWGRYVYLTLLFGLAAAIFNYLYGDAFILRADGLVLRDKTSIAATYIAQVDSVLVREGQPVQARPTPPASAVDTDA